MKLTVRWDGLVVGAALAVLSMAACAAPASAASPAKYCIMRGGGEASAGYTGNCIFNEYEQCLQVAARGGNCVANIDYHGDASDSQPVAEPRARRRGR